jgi:hypothetical protein
MQQTKPIHLFDINPIMIDVEKAIQQGLNNLLANYIERHEILEKTHQQLIQLPSIAQELNKRKSNICVSDSESETENCDYSRYFGIKHNSRGMSYIDNVSKSDSRLDKLEKNFDSIVPILDLLVGKISSLQNDINEMKQRDMKVEDIVHTTDIIEKSSVVKTSENENIEIHIEEPCVIEEVQEEEISDDEDGNPALITCSTISLKPEEVKEFKNEYEVSEEHIEDDEELSVEQELGIEEHTEKVEKTQTEEDTVEEEEQEQDEEDTVEEEEQEQDEEETVEEEQQDEEASIETETKSDAEDEQEEEQEAKPSKTVVEESQPSEEDDEELFEIEIDDKTYCTNNDQNGFIWELTEEGEQGEKIGYFEDGDAYFYEDEK